MLVRCPKLKLFHGSLTLLTLTGYCVILLLLSGGGGVNGLRGIRRLPIARSAKQYYGYYEPTIKLSSTDEDPIIEPAVRVRPHKENYFELDSPENDEVEYDDEAATEDNQPRKVEKVIIVEEPARNLKHRHVEPIEKVELVDIDDEDEPVIKLVPGPLTKTPVIITDIPEERERIGGLVVPKGMGSSAFLSDEFWKNVPTATLLDMDDLGEGQVNLELVEPQFDLEDTFTSLNYAKQALLLQCALEYKNIISGDLVGNPKVCCEFHIAFCIHKPKAKPSKVTSSKKLSEESTEKPKSEDDEEEVDEMEEKEMVTTTEKPHKRRRNQKKTSVNYKKKMPKNEET